MKDSKSILIVAAEASSALYAERLLEYWHDQGMKLKSFGIGSEQMCRLGFEAIGRSEDLAVVGIQEVLTHWSDIWGTFYKLIDEADSRQPKLALLLDYPDFNLRLAKKLKGLNIPIVYYISPQIWAWRQSRVHAIRRTVDKMLVLFPFEKDFYEKYNVPVEFVGHPLLDELFLSMGNKPKHDTVSLREQFDLKKSDLVLGLMPGSRHSELNHHLRTQLETAEILCQQHPDLKIALLVAPSLKREHFEKHLKKFSHPIVLIQGEPFEMVDAVDVVLCASGTATLIVGLMQKPMVIMYKMNSLTAFLAKRLVTSTPFFGMVNLILGREVVPEFFQEKASPQNLAFQLMKFLASPEKRAEISSELAQLREVLGTQGATSRVSQVIEREFL